MRHEHVWSLVKIDDGVKTERCIGGCAEVKHTILPDYVPPKLPDIPCPHCGKDIGRHELAGA